MRLWSFTNSFHKTEQSFSSLLFFFTVTEEKYIYTFMYLEIKAKEEKSLKTSETTHIGNGSLHKALLPRMCEDLSLDV